MDYQDIKEVRQFKSDSDSWIICGLIEDVEKLKKLCKEAGNIMDFHTLRCPLDIPNNFSGMEEHLATYRRVLKQLKEIN